MKRVYKVFTISIGIIFMSVLAVEAQAQPATTLFARQLCAGWNASDLPQKLGSEEQGGSGWVDVVTGVARVPAGTQIIASGRYNCSQTPEFIITIEKQADGRALCAGHGVYNGTRTWQFLPETNDWKEYARSFGMGAFFELWNNGMEGDKTTAWNNSDHFQKFFQIATGLSGEYLRPGCVR